MNDKRLKVLEQALKKRVHQITADKDIKHLARWVRFNSYYQTSDGLDVFEFNDGRTMSYAMRWLKSNNRHLEYEVLSDQGEFIFAVSKPNETNEVDQRYAN